jgi:hypothetical protein
LMLLDGDLSKLIVYEGQIARSRTQKPEFGHKSLQPQAVLVIDLVR